jgi:GT2 family glycosyltransferase
MNDISILIVNYNTKALVMQCVEALLKQQGVTYDIVVVDNCSQDDSVASLKAYEPQITVIANRDNKGFGAANNQAFQVSQGRYVFMLNPDAICMTDYDLRACVDYMEAHPEVGLAGTRILNSEGVLQQTAFDHYPRQAESKTDFSHLPGQLASVLGASMLMSRELFAYLHGFDERFFLYAEETDLCLRVRQMNKQIGYCETVTVKHVGGASERKTPPDELIRKKKSAKILFFEKHYPADAVKSMMLRDLRYARWHLLRLGVLKKLFGLNDKQAIKYRQLNVVRELARNFLAK